MKKLATLFLAAFASGVFAEDLFVQRVNSLGVKDRYESKASYPSFQGSSPLALMANRQIKSWVAARQKDFLQEGKEFFGKNPEKPIVPWTQNIESKVTAHTAKAISVRIRAHLFTGGAHPVYEDFVFNYATVSGKPKRLVLSDLFADKTAAIKRIEGTLIRKLKATGNAMWLEDGTVTKLEPEQLNRFVIGPKGLTFLFNPYEVGPWSAGNFEIPLTFKELGPKFKKNLVLP